METDTGGAHIPTLAQLYCIYCIYTFCAHPHTPISLSDKVIKGKADELVSFSIMLHVVFRCTQCFFLCHYFLKTERVKV